MVLAAVAQNGRALLYASVELWADREFVLAAVAQDGRALWYASAELRADREVVLAVGGGAGGSGAEWQCIAARVGGAAGRSGGRAGSSEAGWVLHRILTFE
eukprot:COSAG01_NODE_2758_length_7121_cov_64.907434_6_plen_101_part_00